MCYKIQSDCSEESQQGGARRVIFETSGHFTRERDTEHQERWREKGKLESYRRDLELLGPDVQSDVGSKKYTGMKGDIQHFDLSI